MGGGIVRIARRHRLRVIMSSIMFTITAGTPDGLRLARPQSARLLAD